jgi:hypothetical protein
MLMPAQPMALGYLRTDNDKIPGQSLSEQQVRFRRNAILNRAAEQGLRLTQLYVEDAPGGHRVLSRLFGAACFHVVNEDALDAILVFDITDLGPTGPARTRTRERITDLDLRLEIVAPALMTSPSTGLGKVAPATATRESALDPWAILHRRSARSRESE